MDYLRRALGMKSKDETPVPSKPPLTEEEVFNTERNHFLIKGLQNPSNQQIAEILGRTIEEVNVFRPPGPSLPTYYDGDDDGTSLYNDPKRQQIIDDFLKKTSGKAKGLETYDSAIFKARNTYDHVPQGENTTRQQKINTGLPLNQDPNLRFVRRTTDGGRKNHKTISNKNKKKHKKLSRRRRHYHSKKNRKSIKRK
jgi:hypothetical protein